MSVKGATDGAAAPCAGIGLPKPLASTPPWLRPTSCNFAQWVPACSLGDFAVLGALFPWIAVNCLDKLRWSIGAKKFRCISCSMCQSYLLIAVGVIGLITIFLHVRLWSCDVVWSLIITSLGYHLCPAFLVTLIFSMPRTWGQWGRIFCILTKRASDLRLNRHIRGRLARSTETTAWNTSLGRIASTIYFSILFLHMECSPKSTKTSSLTFETSQCINSSKSLWLWSIFVIVCCCPVAIFGSCCWIRLDRPWSVLCHWHGQLQACLGWHPSRSDAPYMADLPAWR